MEVIVNITAANVWSKSRKLLQGDEGWSSMVWMTNRLKYVSIKSWIATEDEVTSLEELRPFKKITRLLSDIMDNNVRRQIMIAFFQQLHPVTQAFIATLFTWSVTAAGAALVFFTRAVNQKLMDSMLGFAAGVMIAASFWSLLAPGIEMAEQLGQTPWLTAVIGFLGGGIFMRLTDKFLPHLHPGLCVDKNEGVKTSWQRSTLLVLAITLHNIPEGLAVGVAFGAAAANLPSATIGGAIALALGVGIQNFPEGTAVSMPLRREGMTNRKSFFMGQASGTVEPIAGVIGAIFVLKMQNILPYALCFAAGAMIFVVVEELIPESQKNHASIDLVTMTTMTGFSVMMILDVALG